VNNVAVAAEYARDRYPEVERVLIFDWDVHHGQGTQQIFEQSPDVLVISVHRHDGHSFYPATGSAGEVGSGPGRGYSVNVALPAGYGGAALWTACAHVLLPAARNFQPQLILVSAGFDAAASDPLGGCFVEPRVFGALTAELRRLAAEVAEGRLILALEGGYNPEVLADCVDEVAAALVADASSSGVEAFAEAPSWLAGSACFGAIRRTCEAHRMAPLRLPLPSSRIDRRRAAARQAEALSSPSSRDAGDTGGGEVSAHGATTTVTTSANLGAGTLAARPSSMVTGEGRRANGQLVDVLGIALAGKPSASPWPEAQRTQGSAPGTPAPATGGALPPAETAESPGSVASGAAVAQGPVECQAAARQAGECPGQAPAPAGAGAAPGGRGVEAAAAQHGQDLAPAAGPGAAALVELQTGELVVRIAPLPRPKDVVVSAEELWVWHDQGGPLGVQRWRFEGVRAENSGALRCAEFRSKRHELTVRLRLGPILGGTVGLAPVAA